MAKQDKTSRKQVVRNEKGQIIQGTANPAGRPKGSVNFATKWKKFIEKVAEDNGMTPAEIDEQLYKVAWEKARKGDYQFYKDIQDRVYGRPQQSVDHTTGGQPLSVNVINYAPSDESIDDTV